MSWNYDPNLVADLDKVRFWIGDTDTSDQQLQDSEIQYLLKDEGSVRMASVSACETIAAKYARLVTSQVGTDMRANFSDRQKHYLSLADRLRRRAGSLPYGGGITVADVEAHREDTSLIPAYFYEGMDEEPSVVRGMRIDPNEVTQI